MIKLICDKCAEEVSSLHTEFDTEEARDIHGAIITSFNKAKYELCNKCYEQYKRLGLGISEYMEKPLDELNLLDSPFKVGDKVITSIGEVGVVTDICQCKKCKKRGFYEPTIETEIGAYNIWITDSDKKNNFSNFYSIGNHIYGNINEKGLHDIISIANDNLVKCTKKIKELKKQLEVLKKCKAEQEGN